MRPGEAVDGVALLAAAAGQVAAHPRDADPAGGVHIAHVVVVPDIENQVLRGEVLLRLGEKGAAPGVVDAIPPDPEVADRLEKMRGEDLLPGLPVVHLGALGVAVAVGVDAAGLPAAMDHPAVTPALLVMVVAEGLPRPVVEGVVLHLVAEDGMELQEAFLLRVEYALDFFGMVRGRVEELLEVFEHGG